MHFLAYHICQTPEKDHEKQQKSTRGISYISRKPAVTSRELPRRLEVICAYVASQTTGNNQKFKIHPYHEIIVRRCVACGVLAVYGFRAFDKVLTVPYSRVCELYVLGVVRCAFITGGYIFYIFARNYEKWGGGGGGWCLKSENFPKFWG